MVLLNHLIFQKALNGEIATADFNARFRDEDRILAGAFAPMSTMPATKPQPEFSSGRHIISLIFFRMQAAREGTFGHTAAAEVVVEVAEVVARGGVRSHAAHGAGGVSWRRCQRPGRTAIMGPQFHRAHHA